MSEDFEMKPIASMSSSRSAWLLVMLLAPVALLNYLDRQMLATMKFSVMRDLADIHTEADWGRMLGQFKWVYAFLSPVGGYLADHFSRRHVICGSLFVWSAVTWWTGQVQSFSELLMARSLMGISEAFYLPAALALITDHHLAATRSRAIGIHQMGIYTGVIIAGFSGYAADHPHLGWRWAFELCGLLGLLYTLPLLLWLREKTPKPTTPSKPSLSPWKTLCELFGNFSFILLVCHFTLPALAGWIVRDWIPAILKTEFHLGQDRAGVSATLYWQVAAIVGAIWGSWLADRWTLRNDRGRIWVSILGVTLLIPALFGVGYAPQTGLLWVAISFLLLFGIGWGFFDCNNMPILSQIARPEIRATGYGIMNFVSISAGGLADVAFGWMRDRQTPLFGICSLFAIAALVSVLLALFIRPSQGTTER